MTVNTQAQNLIARYNAGRLAPTGHFGLYMRIKALAASQHRRVFIDDLMI